jgi:hypothetical protein
MKMSEIIMGTKRFVTEFPDAAEYDGYYKTFRFPR